MSIRSFRLFAVSGLFATAAVAQPNRAGGGRPDELPAATRALMRAYPGVKTHSERGRVCALYGRPMSRGASPLAAEADFWSNHRAALGTANLDILPTASRVLSGGKFTVFQYQQYLGGLPVEYSAARLLVLNGDEAKVVYAAGNVADAPALGFLFDAVPADLAVLVVSSDARYKHLRNFSTPELVVYAGDPTDGTFARVDPVRAWKFTAEFPSRANYERYTFFVDAAGAELVHVRNEVWNADVTGTVQGWATPIKMVGNPPKPLALPDEPNNPPTLQPLPHILVQIVGGNSAYTDPNGNFTITHGGTDPVTVQVSLDNGLYANVQDPNAATLSLSQLVTPGTPGNFTFNSDPNGHPANSHLTAQVNGFIYANAIHDFFTDRLPGWAALDHSLVVNVNYQVVCSQNWSFFAINFGSENPNNIPPCKNSAYVPFIAHEYGHFVVQQLGLAQSKFGEGFGDTCSLMLTDDPCWGREFTGSGNCAHNYAPGQPEHVYPSQEPNADQVLGGLWRDIREKLSVDYGGPHADPTALQVSRQLFADWSQITLGGVIHEFATGSRDYQAAHPLTLIEILTVDDLDGDLTNGTPNCQYICAAAGDHGLVCGNVSCADSDPNVVPPGTDYNVSFRTPLIWYTSSSDPNDPSNGVDPFGVAVGKINNDAYKDVVIACEGGANAPARVLVYHAKTPTADSIDFNPPDRYSLGQGANARKVALKHVSLNSQAPDNKRDIIVTMVDANGVGGVQILINKGDGTFDPGDPAFSRFVPVQDAAGGAIKEPIGLWVNDWDINGRVDIAVAGYQDDNGTQRPTLGVLWAETDGTFTPWARQLSGQVGRGFDLEGWSQDALSQPPGFGPGGIPNIKLRRLAMTNEADDPNGVKLTVFDYVDPRNFNVFQRIDAVKSRGVTSGKFNVDDLQDLAITDTSSRLPNAWWFSQSPNDFTFAARYPTSLDRVGLAQGIDAGRLTKIDSNPPTLDSRVDLAVSHRDPARNHVGVLVNAGETTLELSWFDYFWIGATPDPTDDSPRSWELVVVDINADGLPDIVTTLHGRNGYDQSEGFSVVLNRVY